MEKWTGLRPKWKIPDMMDISHEIGGKIRAEINTTSAPSKTNNPSVGFHIIQ